MTAQPVIATHKPQDIAKGNTTNATTVNTDSTDTIVVTADTTDKFINHTMGKIMSTAQPTLSESMPGLILMAIIGVSIAIYYGISEDSSAEVESLKAQIAAKNTQLSKSRSMLSEILSENMALSMNADEPQEVKDHAVLQLMRHYDRIIDCVGGGSCELVSENDRKI